jgi:hypothetical protein
MKAVLAILDLIRRAKGPPVDRNIDDDEPRAPAVGRSDDGAGDLCIACALCLTSYGRI